MDRPDNQRWKRRKRREGRQPEWNSPCRIERPRSRPQSYHSQNDLILVIDLGSSSVRASAYMTNGERLEDASVSRGAEQATDGTFDPHALTELTEQVVGDCLERVRSMGGDFRFIAVAWTSFAMSWLGADRSGQPITPVYSYADTRSRFSCRPLAART